MRILDGLRGACPEADDHRKEITITCAAIAVCVLSLLLVYRDLDAVAFPNERLNTLVAMESISFGILISLVVYGALVYLFARIGYMWRRANLILPPKANLEKIYASGCSIPSVCILIPSYKEELQVLRQTVISAALAEYPARRIVVLLDDPPQVVGTDLEALVRARNLVQLLHNRFRGAATRFRAELSNFLVRRYGAGGCDIQRESQQLADLYEDLADWVEELGSAWSQKSSVEEYTHSDKFFLERIISAPAAAHRARATGLRQSSPDPEQVELEYQRLAGLLHVPITSFERKEHTNLSHAPNKAMNLNSYISLIGKSFKKTVVSSGLCHLQECESHAADLTVPHAEYLLTLDADSFILPDYILKLSRIMNQDPRIAVAQTPYSAVPGSRRRLERAAGAQTDLQYIVHQGFTYFDATYWVGANALLRYDALLDIRCIAHERGHPVEVFIQDRTVIEDTGSTIDLVRRGWRLHNHPERLAYSATPPDFGSLIIQRRRWANGGLIIFANLIRHALGSGAARCSISELVMRAHYLCSPAFGGAVVLLLVMLPFEHPLSYMWLLCTALPYYVLSARDILRCRYSWSDLAGVYALNLMLIPINCAGVFRSVQQILTGRKAPFCRTPKVENRTSIPPLHIALQIALFATITAGAATNLFRHKYSVGVLCGVNAAFLLYGSATLIGWHNAYKDLLQGLRPHPGHRLLQNEWPCGKKGGASSGASR